jgi:hypothetical protein
MTSWSVHFIGRSDAVKRALAAYGDSLHGPTQASYNRAQRILGELLDLNNGHGQVSLNASGTIADNGTQKISVVLMPSNAMHVQ